MHVDDVVNRTAYTCKPKSNLSHYHSVKLVKQSLEQEVNVKCKILYLINMTILTNVHVVKLSKLTLNVR